MGVQFTYAKLRGRIKEKFGTETRFATALGVSLVTVSKKLNGTVQFTMKDMKKWSNILGIPTEEVGDYFFT